MPTSKPTVQALLAQVVAISVAPRVVLPKETCEDLVSHLEFSLLDRGRLTTYLRILAEVTEQRYRVFRSLGRRLHTILRQGLNALPDDELLNLALDPACLLALSNAVGRDMPSYWISRIEELCRSEGWQPAAESRMVLQSRPNRASEPTSAKPELTLAARTSRHDEGDSEVKALRPLHVGGRPYSFVWRGIPHTMHVDSRSNVYVVTQRNSTHLVVGSAKPYRLEDSGYPGWSMVGDGMDQPTIIRQIKRGDSIGFWPETREDNA